MQRNPAVAGMFYPGDSETLKEQLMDFFRGTKENNFKAVISPHAGYAYSGKTAAWAISGLEKSDKFIILGPNHTGLGSQFSVYSSGSWQTPLGNCKVDEMLAKKILELAFIEKDQLAHSQEHSIEVQLPFLQHKFGEFSFVPICIMSDYSTNSLDKLNKLGEKIAELTKADPSVRVIASSDFTHFEPANVTEKKDEQAIEAIKSLDTAKFFQILQETSASVCGFAPITVLMATAKKLNWKPEVIHKSNSGEKTGDYDSVVSYYAVGFG